MVMDELCLRTETFEKAFGSPGGLVICAPQVRAGEAQTRTARAYFSKRMIGRPNQQDARSILSLFFSPVLFFCICIPRNLLTRWDVSSIPANGIFLTKN